MLEPQALARDDQREHGSRVRSSTIAGPHGRLGRRPFTFVTEGVEAAVKQASAQAGDGSSGSPGASVVRQYLNAGILDAVRSASSPT